METPEQIDYRVKELRAAMHKKNNVIRVVALATSLRDASQDLPGRLLRGREMAKGKPSLAPYLEAMEASHRRAEEVLDEVVGHPEFVKLAAKVIFDGEEIAYDPSDRRQHDNNSAVRHGSLARPVFAGYHTAEDGGG